MRYPSLKQITYLYKRKNNKPVAPYIIAQIGDNLLDREHLIIARQISRKLGYYFIHRSKLRLSPYRLALKVRTRSGTYALIPKSRPLSKFLIDPLSDPEQD